MPTLSQSEKLEFLVIAEKWDEVVDKMRDVGVTEKTKINRREVKGLFILEVSLPLTELTDEFYEKIKNHTDISLISDSASWRRSKLVLDEVYKVETELRKLLLHVYDLVEAFYDVFLKTQYAKNLAKTKSMTVDSSLDPLTSQIMLGEMVDILGLNLSWGKRGITGKDLMNLLGKASDLAELKQELGLKLQNKRVWDIIAEHVLKQKITWEEIEPELRELKDFRNKAAHFQIITDGQKDALVKTAKAVYGKIVKQQTLKTSQLGALDQISKTLADSINGMQVPIREALRANQLARVNATIQAGMSLNEPSSALQVLLGLGQPQPSPSILSGLASVQESLETISGEKKSSRDTIQGDSKE